MLTELFLNSCFSLVLNKSTKIKRTKVIYRDILDILNFYKNKQQGEIPINIQNKLECLHEICKLKVANKSDDNVLDSITFGEKFKGLVDFIVLKRNENISDEILSDHISQIRMRKKLNGVVSNYDEISKRNMIKQIQYIQVIQYLTKMFLITVVLKNLDCIFLVVDQVLGNLH